MVVPVEEFDILCSEDAVRGLDADIAVYGQPFHESVDELISRYVEESRTTYLAHEQTSSCGNYLLVDTSERGVTRIITAPGYASGYFYAGESGTRVSSLLSRTVESWLEGETAINDRFLEYYLNTDRNFQGTPFQGIGELRPGMELSIENGVPVKQSCYLTQNRAADMSLMESYRSCATALSDSSVTVMFSGGLDSLSWYLALHEQLPDSRLDLVTVDWMPGTTAQGPELSLHVADKLDLDIDIVTFDDEWISSDQAVVNHLTEWMRRDLARPRNPNHALVTHDDVNEVVVNLTNNESAIVSSMNHVYLRRYINSNNSLQKNLYNVAYLILNRYLNNVLYTGTYMRRSIPRVAYFTLAWAVYNLADSLYRGGSINHAFASSGLGNVDPSDRGVLKAMVSRQAPNVRTREYDNLFEEELSDITAYFDTADIHYLAKLTYYYAHMACTCNWLEKLPLSDRTRTEIPVTWGPMLDATLWKDLTLADAISPRKELAQYVEERTGYAFEDLQPWGSEASTSDDRVPAHVARRDLYSSILDEHGHRLSLDRSTLSSYLVGDAADAYERELMSVQLVRGNGRAEYRTLTKAHRILNLELILEHAASGTGSVKP